MTIKTFWLIFIKVLGLWLVFDTAMASIQFFTTLIYMDDFGSMVAAIIGLLVFFYIIRMFLFRTEWLIEILRLEKGFSEDKIEFNTDQTNALNVAILVIGGLVLIDSIPQLCKEAFSFYQDSNIFRNNPSTGYLIFYLLKSIIGYLLMTNSRFVADFIFKKSKDKFDF